MQVHQHQNPLARAVQWAALVLTLETLAGFFQRVVLKFVPCIQRSDAWTPALLSAGLRAQDKSSLISLYFWHFVFHNYCRLRCIAAMHKIYRNLQDYRESATTAFCVDRGSMMPARMAAIFAFFRSLSAPGGHKWQ